jgi:hypothetical protein
MGKPFHDHTGDVARYVGCSVVALIESAICLERALGFITIFLAIVVQSLSVVLVSARRNPNALYVWTGCPSQVR